LTSCDGQDTDIIANQQCTVPIATLKASPYLIVWGGSIYAKVIAKNVVGSSLASDEGNGAIIFTTPDPPTDVINVVANTNGYALGLSWTAADNGGSEIIDYAVSVQDNDETVELVSTGIVAKDYIVSGVNSGVLYKVRVQARNSEGYSDYSSYVYILAA
jgi:hypothetical protein